MASPFSTVLALAKRQPLLVAGGVGAVGLLAFVASRGSSGTAPLAPDETGAEAPDLLGIGSGDGGGSPYAGAPGAGYSDPLGGLGGLGYDPFGGAGTDPYGAPTPTEPGTTADGCTWPPPAVPTGYEGRGSWQCDAGSWVWHWIDAPPADGGSPGTTKGGCPLPKPTLAPRLAGRYRFVCRRGKWQLVPIGSTPAPKPQQRPNVSRGQHVVFAGHRNARGHLILTDRRVINLAHAQHWELGPAKSGDRTPGRHGGEVRVRRIKATGSGRAGLVGLWLKV